MTQYGKEIWGTVKDKNPVVRTLHGQVRGDNREGVAIFRGIPYGGDCTESRRFLPPKKVDGWKGVKDCTRNGYLAVQHGCSISGDEKLGDYFSGGKRELFGTENERQNENCLVLNVVTPGFTENDRPVVVYIHGGGYSNGSGTLVLGADRWAREENLVIVGINHRLNVFGYLYLGEFASEYEQSGIAGMFDLVLALEWVRDNIRAFGGNPDQVTIMGESGGGMKVNTLLAMKNAHGLFSKAIIESCPMAVGHISKERGTMIAHSLLKQLGIDYKNWREILDISAKELIKGAVDIENKAGGMLFSPIADGSILEYQKDGYILAQSSRNIPVLIGASEDELAIFMPEKVNQVTWGNIKEKLLENRTGQILQNSILTEENIDEILAVFEKINQKGDSAEHLYYKILSTLGSIGGDPYEEAEAIAAAGGRVYQYLITYDSLLPGEKNKRYSWHTADLPLQMRIVQHEESELISRQMAHCWAAFIRSGNPTTEELIWPQYSRQERKIMVFDKETRMRYDPLRLIRTVRSECRTVDK